MRSTRLLFGTALAALALTGAPALAQGEKESSAIELAEAAQGLEPGQWVWAPQISPEGPVVVLVDLTSQGSDFLDSLPYRVGEKTGLRDSWFKQGSIGLPTL